MALTQADIFFFFDEIQADILIVTSSGYYFKRLRVVFNSFVMKKCLLTVDKSDSYQEQMLLKPKHKGFGSFSKRHVD